MHGLVNRSIQLFVTDTFGPATWNEICTRAGLGFTQFEAMMCYERSYTPDLLDAMSAVLSRPRPEVLEDFGTYLISNPSFAAVRRLLRFSGEDFCDFLYSLDDLPDRVRLAVPELHLPALRLEKIGPDRFSLRCGPGVTGFGHVVLGVLRALADEYGALALLVHDGLSAGCETISITLVQNDFATGRRFALAADAP
jgi:hypothetical protein